MRKVLLSWMVAFAALAGSLGFGQDASEPVVVVSFAGYDQLLKTVGELSTAAGNPALAAMVEARLAEQLGEQGLKALDAKQPAGVALAFGDEPMPIVYGFLPVTEPKKLLEALKITETESLPGGLLGFTAPDGRKYVLKTQSQWTYVAADPAHLAKVGDPAKMLGGLEKQYLLAARINMKALPEPLRQLALSKIQEFSDGISMLISQPLPGEEAEATAARIKQFQFAIKQIVRLFNELDQLTIGTTLDASTKKTVLDLVATFKADSQTAKELGASAGLKTGFSGFLTPDAVIAAGSTAKNSAEEKEPALDMIKTARANLAKVEIPPITEKPDFLKKVIDRMLGVVEEIVKSDGIDYGASLIVNEKALTLIAGMRSLDVEPHKNVRFVNIPLDTAKIIELMNLPPEAAPVAEQLKGLLGEKVEWAAAIGEKAVYFGLGRDAQKTVEAAVAKSKSEGLKDAVPSRLSLSFAKVAQLVGLLGDESAKMPAKMMEQVLSQTPGQDHLNLTTTLVPNGFKLRLDIEEGVLKAAGMMFMLRMGGGQAAPPKTSSGF